MQLKNKTVLVTGGARRVGKALCKAFAEYGAKVIIHYFKSSNEATELLESLPGEGHAIVEGDLGITQVSENLLFNCNQKIDVLVNNASIYSPQSLMCEDAHSIDSHLAINYKAPLILMQQFARQDLQEGCIINFLDQEVGKAAESFGSYGTSKRALRDATLTAAIELAPKIRVNAIAPGPVFAPVGLEHCNMEKTLHNVPLGKKVETANLAQACKFLIENDAVTGQVLYIDGGQHLIQRHNS